MTASSLPGQRLLAWAILLLGLAALWLGIVLPVAGHVAAARHETARLATLAERYEAEARGGDAALQRLRDLATGAPETSLLLPRATDAQSQAALQERVKALLTQNGGVLTGLQPQAARMQGPWRSFPLTVQFTADMPALQRVLHAIETQEPTILVEMLQVRGRAAAGGAPALDVALDLAAFGAGAAP